MGKTLNMWLKMNRQPSAREEVGLNLNVASGIMKNKFEKLLAEYNITGSQYNVLRILKGVFPEGHPRCEIITRMVDRAPDITRLIDRLEKQGLVIRDRTKEDRRMSITKITEKGLNLIVEVQPLVEKTLKEATRNLSDDECKELSRLIEKLYESEV